VLKVYVLEVKNVVEPLVKVVYPSGVAVPVHVPPLRNKLNVTVPPAELVMPERVAVS